MRITRRDCIWIAFLLVPSLGWWCEHRMAFNRRQKSQAALADLAVALQKQVELSEQMRQRLDEYENQHVLMRRLLRTAQQRRE